MRKYVSVFEDFLNTKINEDLKTLVSGATGSGESLNLTELETELKNKYGTSAKIEVSNGKHLYINNPKGGDAASFDVTINLKPSTYVDVYANDTKLDSYTRVEPGSGNLSDILTVLFDTYKPGDKKTLQTVIATLKKNTKLKVSNPSV